MVINFNSLYHSDVLTSRRPKNPVNIYYHHSSLCGCSPHSTLIATSRCDLVEQHSMSAPAGRSFYEALGVAPNAQKQDIRNAYRRLALRYHPDKNQGDLSAKVLFQEVSHDCLFRDLSLIAYGPAKRSKPLMKPSLKTKNAPNTMPLPVSYHQIAQDAHGGNHPTVPAMLIRKILRSGP